MNDSAIATAADYADAMMTARRAKNVLFVIILLMLLAQMALFFVFRYKINPTPGPGQAGSHLDHLKYLIGLIDLLGIAAPLVLGVDLLLIAGIMLVGRLIGISRVIAAFLWCVVLAVLLFPWQAFLINQTFTSTEFKWPGVLYTWAELLARARIHPADAVLFWGRFVIWPVIAVVILVTLQWQSRHGMRLALGETAPPAIGRGSEALAKNM